MISQQLLILAQRNTDQSEYTMAYALIIGLVVLGLIVVCIPRPRTKHFIEPDQQQEEKKNYKK